MFAAPRFPGFLKNKKQKERATGCRSLLPASFLMLILAGLLSLCARKIPGFAQGYSVTVYAVLKNTLGSLCGLVPFSLSEAGLYGLILFLIWDIVRNLRQPLKILSHVFFLASGLFLSFTLNCGINYYRTPFSYEAGFSTQPASSKELYALCEYLTVQVNKCIEEMENEEAVSSESGGISLYPGLGQTTKTPAPSWSYLREAGRKGQKAMAGLGALYPQLSGHYPYPKPLVNSRLLSIQQLCGIYSPFTIEANYNREMPYYNIPHTICHELSHLKGYMREDEANFIGYLACITSDSADFRYSGYLTGWVYAGNALAKADINGYSRLHEKLAPKAIADLTYNNSFWDQYEGKVAEASNQINDSYLKAHSQTDGVQSYGRMVDLMLAYYAKMER